MKAKFLLVLLSLVFAIQACDNNNPKPETPTGSAGYFVVNEGAFNKNNTSLSFFDRTTGEMSNDVFVKANGRPLGDQAQSLTVYKDKAFVVVQHSAKIEVIGASDFKSITTISDQLESPRYMLVVNDSKAYVSDWGADGLSGSVKIIDLNEMKVTGLILTGVGPNEMTLNNGKVYVANSGGYGTDHSIAVIDTSSDKVVSVIAVGDNPMGMRFDINGDLWTLNAGYVAYNDDFSINLQESSAPSFSKITNDKEVLRLTISAPIGIGMSHLNINTIGNQLYFILNGSIFSMPITAKEVPITTLIGDSFYYGLNIDPITDEIIVSEAPDFTSPGNVYVYNPLGTRLKSYKVGIGPNGAYFK